MIYIQGHATQTVRDILLEIQLYLRSICLIKKEAGKKQQPKISHSRRVCHTNHNNTRDIFSLVSSSTHRAASA